MLHALWQSLLSVAREHTDTPALPPRESIEIRIGIEAWIDGIYRPVGFHGWLDTGREPRDEDDELEYLIAALLAAIPKAKRETIAKQLQRKRIDRNDGPHITTARRLLKAVRTRTDVSLRLTPSYKPRN